jgi:hypothetical protein
LLEKRRASPLTGSDSDTAATISGGACSLRFGGNAVFRSCQCPRVLDRNGPLAAAQGAQHTCGEAAQDREVSGMNDLDKRLRELARSVPQCASDDVEQHLLTEFRAHRRRSRIAMYLMPAAAALILGLALLVYHGSNIVRGYLGSSGTVREPQAGSLQGFMPLPYGESGVPLGQGIVLRMQLPVSELNGLGVPVPPGETRQRVHADVLVGQDGVARAVRFVQ